MSASGTRSTAPPPKRSTPMVIGSAAPARKRVATMAVPPKAVDKMAARTPDMETYSQQLKVGPPLTGLSCPGMGKERPMSVLRLNKLWRVLAGSAALFVLTSAAEARPARCFTSDDGPYACQFAAADRRGSFRISAPGKPTILLNVDQPG